ncbi:MAG: radical SAM protein [Deltaproteobacteria bacterium HGW-Deltaproteobacteria-14]|jgi:putative pyruvate formate lyase activating enzyme|nr:MAG: radical SAM protein [Deltaproteobacteria bacterium HGW-Deltaproteobacteria-14]
MTTPAPHIDRDRLAAARAWAEERYHACDVCAERCLVNRHAGELGVCGLPVDARVYKEYLHLGEEARLVPSHTIYLSGCNFRCAFCSDDAQVRAPLAHGVNVPPAALARRIAERRAQGARNVNFVGGLPDVNVLYILRVLERCPPDTAVVWNTNLWTTPEAIATLTGVVWTWLVDFKFGNDRCAEKLAGARDYLRTITELLPLAAGAGAVLIRHLLMPGHLDCCTRPVLDWLAANLPEIPVNVMTGYHPYRMVSGRGPMARALPAAERELALATLGAQRFADLLIDGTEYRLIGSGSAS